MRDWFFAPLPRKRFRALLVDPPWRFRTWNNETAVRARATSAVHYQTMPVEQIAMLPVGSLAANDSVLFLWTTWPMLEDALGVARSWGFAYKTCGFDWMKVNGDGEPAIGLGYWTRANSEPCLLFTRGSPKRRNADVGMGVIEPRREHSRKPDCVHERIERLVSGPYLELFARRSRPGWTTWGAERTKFDQPLASAE